MTETAIDPRPDGCHQRLYETVSWRVRGPCGVCHSVLGPCPWAVKPTHPEVTDVMIEAAARVIQGTGSGSWHMLPVRVQDKAREKARLALTAGLTARDDAAAVEASPTTGPVSDAACYDAGQEK